MLGAGLPLTLGEGVWFQGPKFLDKDRCLKSPESARVRDRFTAEGRSSEEGLGGRAGGG